MSSGLLPVPWGEGQKEPGGTLGSSSTSPLHSAQQQQGIPPHPAFGEAHGQPLPAVEFLRVLFSHDMEAVGDGGILQREGAQRGWWHSREIEPRSTPPWAQARIMWAQLFGLGADPMAHAEMMEEPSAGLLTEY